MIGFKYLFGSLGLARSTGKELETRNGVKKTGYDSNTVRCATDAAGLSR